MNELVIGHSQNQVNDRRKTSGAVHSYTGARLVGLCFILNCYLLPKTNTVAVIAGFFDHRFLTLTFRWAFQLVNSMNSFALNQNKVRSLAIAFEKKDQASIMPCH